MTETNLPLVKLGEQTITIDQLVDMLLPHVIDGTVIEGGHFILERVGDQAHPDVTLEGKLTFEAAVQLYAKAKAQGKTVALAFLVADFSVPADKREEFNRTFRLPSAYQEILQKYGVEESEIVLFRESRLRNRSNTSLKKGLKSGLVIESLAGGGKVYLTAAGAVSNIQSEGRNPVANCRMLIAQELADKEQAGYTRAINLCDSVAYKCQGRYALVYQTLLQGTMDVINAYFYDISFSTSDFRITTEVKVTRYSKKIEQKPGNPVAERRDADLDSLRREAGSKLKQKGPVRAPEKLKIKL